MGRGRGAAGEKAADYTPSELQAWGARLVDLLDHDGPEPDDQPPVSVNELRLLRHRARPGGRLVGRFDDAAMFDAIAVAVAVDAQARSTPPTSARPRSGRRRRSPRCAGTRWTAGGSRPGRT